MDANFRFLALDDDAPGFSWRTFRFPADLPRLQTMTRDPQPARPRPAAVRQGRRPADRLSRLGRPGHQRARHAALRRGGDRAWPAARRPPTRSCAPTSCRACTTAAAAPASTASTCSPQLEQWVERGVAPAPRRGLARRRRRRGALASAVPAPAGGGLQRVGLDRRRGQLRLPRRHLGSLSVRRRAERQLRLSGGSKAALRRCGSSARCVAARVGRRAELQLRLEPAQRPALRAGPAAVNEARSSARPRRSRCDPSSASAGLDRDRGRR